MQLSFTKMHGLGNDFVVLEAINAPIELSPADTAWMLASTALVLLMTPALGYFYGGLVRSKNVAMQCIKNVSLFSFAAFMYYLIGYKLMYPLGNWSIGSDETGKGDYFGPFASAGAVDRTINALQKAFLIRTCTDSVYEGRSRPCLLYQIKRCSAPCVGRIDEAGYEELVQQAKDFLGGKSSAVQQDLEKTDEEQRILVRETAARLSRIGASRREGKGGEP